MEKPKTTQKRQIAYKVKVKDLTEGNYVVVDGWEPNYVVLADSTKVSRANLMGVVVSKDTTDDKRAVIVIDDGSSSISLRSFEENKSLQSAMVGELLKIIGRPRKFGTEMCIIPEIIKKVDNRKWIDVRKLELALKEKPSRKQRDPEKVEKTPLIEEPVKKKKESGEDITEEKRSPSVVVYNLIKNMDSGDGVDIEDIIKESKIDDTEQIIKGLLQEGEIFEIKRGKLKVL